MKSISAAEANRHFSSVLREVSRGAQITVTSRGKPVATISAADQVERRERVAAALRAYFAWPRPGEDASDLTVINAHAEELNAEAQDALSYQVPL